MKRQTLPALVFMLCALSLDLLIFRFLMPDYNNARVFLEFYVETEFPEEILIYYGESPNISEMDLQSCITYGGNVNDHKEVPISTKSRYIHIVPKLNGTIKVSDVSIELGTEKIVFRSEQLLRAKFSSDIKVTGVNDRALTLQREGGDAWIDASLGGLDLPERYKKANQGRYIVYCILVCMVADLLLLLFWSFADRAHSPFWDRMFLSLTTQQWLVAASVFLICLGGAVMLYARQCPDEEGRRLLSHYIFSHNRLPAGDESEVIISGWGFSYAFRPYLSSVIGALFMKLASIVTGNEYVLLVMSRMCSVLSITLCCFFCLRLGNEVFRSRRSSILMAVLVCFLPQVMFLGMYLNNDSLSLAAVSMMLFFLVKGHNVGWPIRYCIGMGVSFSVTLLSYYSCYAWGLCCLIAFVWSCLQCCRNDRKHEDNRSLWKGKDLKNALNLKAHLARIAVALGVTFLLAGWFFIRNAVIHNGDFLGIAAEAVSREQRQALGASLYAFNIPRNSGISFIRFLFPGQYRWAEMTVRSMIGYFGHMNCLLPLEQYGEYFMLIILGVIVFAMSWIAAKRKEQVQCLLLLRLLLTTMAISSAATVLLSLLHSYYRDYQPQGRYVITAVIFVSCMIAYGSDRTKISIPCSEAGHLKTSFSNNGIKYYEWSPAIIILWIVMFTRVWFETMTVMII